MIALRWRCSTIAVNAAITAMMTSTVPCRNLVRRETNCRGREVAGGRDPGIGGPTPGTARTVGSIGGPAMSSPLRPPGTVTELTPRAARGLAPGGAQVNARKDGPSLVFWTRPVKDPTRAGCGKSLGGALDGPDAAA